MIVQVDSVLNCHRPVSGVCDFRPVNRSMQHHRSSNRHDGANCSFCIPIGMMCTHSSKSTCLGKLGQMRSELGGKESPSIIRPVGLRNNSMILTELFKVFFGFKSLWCAQMHLEFNVDKVRRMVNEKTTTREHFLFTGSSCRREKTSLGTGLKVVN